MKVNIFLFEHLSRQDFLDPDFSDTCMWVQDPLTIDPKTRKTHFQQTLAVAGKNGPYGLLKEGPHSVGVWTLRNTCMDWVVFG